MLRTKHCDSALTMALCTTLAALTTSCGSVQPGPSAPTASAPTASAPTASAPTASAPTASAPMAPIVTKAESSPSQSTRASRAIQLTMLDAPEFESTAFQGRELEAATLAVYSGVGGTRNYSEHAEPVLVSLQLGPRMATHEFSIGLDGTVSGAELKQLRRLFRCRRSGRTHRISKGLLAKLADLSNHYEGRTIEVVSAYRHGENAKAGSRHRHGRAIDIKVDGVRAAHVRDYLWSRYDAEVGVGFYRQQQFVHLDHRKNYPATAWTQRHHNGQNNYKPRWSRVAKRAELAVAISE